MNPESNDRKEPNEKAELRIDLQMLIESSAAYEIRLVNETFGETSGIDDHLSDHCSDQVVCQLDDEDFKSLLGQVHGFPGVNVMLADALARLGQGGVSRLIVMVENSRHPSYSIYATHCLMQMQEVVPDVIVTTAFNSVLMRPDITSDLIAESLGLLKDIAPIFYGPLQPSLALMSTHEDPRIAKEAAKLSTEFIKAVLREVRDARSKLAKGVVLDNYEQWVIANFDPNDSFSSLTSIDPNQSKKRDE